MKKTSGNTIMIEAMKRHAIRVVLAGLPLCLLGCDSQQGPHAIHEREIKPRMGGGSMPRDAAHGFPSGQLPDQVPAPSQAEAPEIGFDAPEGWVFAPGTGMRLATFKIEDADGVKEATVVVLPASEGGYAANVRRWAGQLGMDIPAMRLEAFLAERDTFSTVQGLSGALFDFTRLADVPDQGKGSMLASMIESGGQTLFVKLTGGAPFLQRNKGKFLALSKSIRLPAEEPAELPPGEPSMSLAMRSDDPAFNRRPEGVSRLTWRTPPGWRSLEAAGMRTGSFSVTYGGKTADGSIVQLPGSAGGIESNVRRWMEQAGLAQFDDDAMQAFLKSQKRIRTRDGFDGILIDLASQLGGNLMQENSILAVIIEAKEETIFVKLTGPRIVLLQNLEPLAELSASLAMAD